jgi:Phage capsid family
MRPAGMRPAGMRPAGMRPYDDTGLLDPEEWSADIAELFCSYSAVVRLGARMVFDVEYLPVPTTQLNAEYLPAPTEIGDDHQPRTVPRGQSLTTVAGTTQSTLGRRRNLKPSKRELVVQFVVRDSLLRAVAHPEVAAALKADIARALAERADAAFLHGAGTADPRGITGYRAPLALQGNRLADARLMLETLRNEPNVRFDNPGWVIDVRTLDELTRLLTRNNLTQAGGTNSRTFDSARLLMLDGDDSGVLLGYPFVATTAAQEATRSRMYFSSDWTEAWIGIGEELVTVAVSTETNFTTDETVVRAVMHHDFAVRNPTRFAITRPF